jgi:hypothetical protein
MAINQLGGGSAALEAKFNAKGDILVATANDVAAAVSVGSNGTILIADSTQSSGVRWGANAPDVATAKGDLITRTTSGYSVLTVGTNGQALLADSTTATGLRWGSSASLPYYYKAQVFTSSGTWTAPTSVQFVDVLAMGGGGGGAAGARIGAGAIASPGGGGAGGTAVFVRNVPVTPGSTYTVTVGAGGAGGTGLNVFQSSSNTTQTTGPTGSAGGDSSFGTAGTIQYVLALGGLGGGTQNAGGGYSRNNGLRFAQYTFGTGDSRQGSWWIGTYTGNTSSLRIDAEQNVRTRYMTNNTNFDDNDQWIYWGQGGESYFWSGGGATSDYSNATAAARMSANPLGAGWQPTRDWAKDSNQWYRNTALPLASGNHTPGAPTTGTNGNQTATSAVQSGIGGGGGRGGLGNTSGATCTAGDFGNVGAGSGGGAGFNGNAGNGGNAGSNSGAGGGGGGGSFGQGTYSSGTGGTGGSGFVVLGWVGA